MSIACISYGSLKNASSEAKHVADKLNKYADHLHSQIYEKLDSYGGQSTDYIEQAMKNVSAKIVDLRGGADSYEKYSSDLSELKNKCVDTDKTVRSKVSELTASFKANNGIKDSNVKNSINYFFTSVGNMNSGVRWLNDKRDKTRSSIKHRMQSIEDWWDYEGGAQCVKGIAVAGLGIGIAICTMGMAVAGVVTAVLASTLTGGVIVASIAATLSGAIALGNAVVDLKNECAAYDSEKNGDPAIGRRRREINTYQDYLRSSFYYGADGENYEYNVGNYILATSIDVVDTVCTVITVVDSAGKLIKNCYQWATLNKVDLGNFASLKLFFSKDGQKAFWTGTLKNICKVRDDALKAIKVKNFGFFARSAKTFFKRNFLVNMNEKYLNFGSVKDGFSSVKSMLTVAKNIARDGIKFKNVMDDIVFPGITVMTINTISEETGGQMRFDFQNEHVKIADISGIADKVVNKIIGNIKFENTTLDSKLIKKLSVPSFSFVM